MFSVNASREEGSKDFLYILLGWTKGVMLYLDPFPLTSKLLKTPHPAIEKIDIHFKPWLTHKPLSQECQGDIEDHPIRWPSWDFSTHLHYLPPVCKLQWASALLLGYLSTGPLLHNKPCAGIWVISCLSIPRCSFISNIWCHNLR
jgi:hypothetical protein